MNMILNGYGRPVVALDIDGTLGDYHEHFLTFAEGWFGRPFRPATDENPGLRLWDFMGVDQRDYRDCKLAYRSGGLKRTMPAYEGASRMTRHVREAGAELWLCTTRPYMRLDNIDPDTREWLRRNNIQYDAVIFDPVDSPDKGGKYDELWAQAGDRVCLIADDLPEMIDAARALWDADEQGQPTMLIRDQPYNRYRDLSAGPTYARRVRSCLEIEEAAEKSIQYWKDIRGA